MSENHTPGPWAQSHRLNRLGTYSTEVYDGSGEVIATLAWHPVKTERGIGTDRAANARLIAASPDMLETLRTLINTFPAGDYTAAQIAAFNAAHAAIRKATVPA